MGPRIVMARFISYVLVFIVLPALAAAGCVDTRRGTSVDSGGTGGRDGGTEPAPPPPPGGVSLAVAAARWGYEGELRLDVVVSNAADGEVAPLVYTAFTLETSGGAIVEAVSWLSEGCLGGIGIAPGASLGCTVGFAPPAGHAPLRVRYRADAERTAQADVRACSASAPRGLCERGAVCEAGTCVTPCSYDTPTGACPGTGERCVGGECVPACSPSQPDGWCTEGTCYEGTCDASCFGFAYSEECYDCLIDGRGTACVDAAPGSCHHPEGCAYCPLGGDTCECAESRECTGCETEARAVWGCVARECPSCVR